MLRRQRGQLRVGRNLGLHCSSFRGRELAIEPGKEFFLFDHCSPTIANSAVRPRTSRLDTVPIGRPSISETSR